MRRCAIKNDVVVTKEITKGTAVETGQGNHALIIPPHEYLREGRLPLREQNHTRNCQPPMHPPLKTKSFMKMLTISRVKKRTTPQRWCRHPEKAQTLDVGPDVTNHKKNIYCKKWHEPCHERNLMQKYIYSNGLKTALNTLQTPAITIRTKKQKKI